MRQFFIFCMALLLSSCGNLYKGSLAVVEDAKPKIESTFQGLYARDEDEGPKRDRFILDVHYNDWLGDRDSVKTGWNSIGFNANALFDFPFNKKSTVSWATGVRFGHSSTQHNGLFFINDSINSSILYPTNDINFTRSGQRFIQSYLEVPLEIRFRGENLKSYRFTLGGSIGIGLNSYEKWRQGDSKYREYNHPNTTLLRASAFARMGYHRWNLFAAYYFTPMFNGAQDSKLNQLQLGFSISIF
jgi:hypothetical protein